mgnify:FL=1
MATLKNKSLKKSLSQQAEENARVTKGTSKNQTVVKEGVPNDHTRKHQCGDRPVVGVNIGSTINMENYESLRADVWLSDTVQPNESIEQAYERVTNIVAKILEHIVETYQ